MCNFYIMYYSHSEDHIPSFMECVNDNFPNFSKHMPTSSMKQLPYNSYLEQKAMQSKKKSQTARGKSDSRQLFQGRQRINEKNYDYPVLDKSYKFSQQNSDDYKTTNQYKRFNQHFDSYDNKVPGYFGDHRLDMQHPKPKNRNRNKAFQILNEQLLSGSQRNHTSQNYIWQNMNPFERLHFLKKEDSQFATSTSLATGTAPHQATVLPATSAAPNAAKAYSVSKRSLLCSKLLLSMLLLCLSVSN